LDELFTSLEIFACKYGVCNVCHEISAIILGEDILMSTTTCVEIQKNSITLEFDSKNVNFSHKQP
jgi:hypothetical protein